MSAFDLEGRKVTDDAFIRQISAGTTLTTASRVTMRSLFNTSAFEHVPLEGNEDIAEEEVKKTELGSTINLTKNLVGSGIFTLPLAMSKASVVPGVILLLFMCILLGGSFWFITFLCKELAVTNYRDVLANTLGPKSSNIVTLAILTTCFASVLGYVILICDFFQESLPELIGWHPMRWQLIVADTLVFILPLTHMNDLSGLKIPSMIGLLIIAYIFTFLLIDWYWHLDVSVATFKEAAFNPTFGLFWSASMFTQAFQAHYNAPTFFMELGSDLPAMSRVVRNSYTIAFFIYICFALAGFGIFGTAVEGNVLRGYSVGGVTPFPVVVALFGMGFSITLTYPLVFNGGRKSLYNFLPPLERLRSAHPNTVHVAVTTSMVCLISLLACFVTDIKVVVGLCGATCGSVLSIILPGAVYLKFAFCGSKNIPAPKVRSKPMIAVSIFLVIIGFMSLVLGTLVVLGIIN